MKTSTFLSIGLVLRIMLLRENVFETNFNYAISLYHNSPLSYPILQEQPYTYNRNGNVPEAESAVYSLLVACAMVKFGR